MTLIIIIVLVVLLFGGGDRLLLEKKALGCFYRRAERMSLEAGPRFIRSHERFSSAL